MHKLAKPKRWPLVMLCVLVFVLSFYAKLSLYFPHSPGSVSTVAASKFWNKGQKKEQQAADNTSQILHATHPMPSMSFVSRFGLPSTPLEFETFHHYSLFDSHLFFRPPPPAPRRG